MKKRNSAQFQLVLFSSLLALALVVSYSKYAVDHHDRGLVAGLHSVMTSMALNTQLGKGGIAEVAGFEIADDWKKLDPIFHGEFSGGHELPVNRVFIAKEKRERVGDGFFLLARPAVAVLVFNTPDGTRYVAHSLHPQKRIENAFRAVQTEDGFSLHKSDPPPRGTKASSVIIDLMGPLLHGIPRHKVETWLYSLILFLFYLFAFLLFFNYGKQPIRKLGQWLSSLSFENAQKELPDFRYAELNQLAGQLCKGVISVHESYEREQRFLKHASHELRTPTSVIASNAELLKLILSENDLPELACEVTDRIIRANKSSAELIETLLWLSRDEQCLPEDETVALDKVIADLVDELSYLKEQKQVEVILHTEPVQLQAPRMFCQIILGNIIRNSYQHTFDGVISIEQKGAWVKVTNPSSLESSLGFGLGLKLIRQLAEKCSWQYDVSSDQESYSLQIKFQS